MVNLSVKRALTESKKRLMADLNNSAHLKGDGCWLWFPAADCKNPSICLVAHIDRVREGSKKVYVDQSYGVYWSPDTLGADDRAGVYACLSIRKQTGCMVLLTDGEETGGTGAREAAALWEHHFTGVTFFCEIDRQGKRQAVYYNDESLEFREFISGFGFREHGGSFSDISILGRALKIPGVNVSAGYYKQHTAAEYLVESHLHETIQAVSRIIEEGDGNYNRETWRVGAYSPEEDPHYLGHYGHIFSRYEEQDKRRWGLCY